MKYLQKNSSAVINPVLVSVHIGGALIKQPWEITVRNTNNGGQPDAWLLCYLSPRMWGNNLFSPFGPHVYYAFEQCKCRFVYTIHIHICSLQYLFIRKNAHIFLTEIDMRIICTFWEIQYYFPWTFIKSSKTRMTNVSLDTTFFSWSACVPACGGV